MNINSIKLHGLIEELKTLDPYLEHTVESVSIRDIGGRRFVSFNGSESSIREISDELDLELKRFTADELIDHISELKDKLSAAEEKLKEIADVIKNY